MNIVKKINLKKIEKMTNKIVELSTRIRFLQEELSHIGNQLEINRKILSSGFLSKQSFEGNKRNFEKKRDEVIGEINEDVSLLLKRSALIQRSLKSNKL